MNPESAHTLSNDFRDVQLYSLHEWPEAPALRGPDGRGPFIVMQRAIDPQDLRSTIEDFVLGKSGRWLPMYLFQQLPKEVRREEYLFPGAADAIRVLEGLTGAAVVERGQPAAKEEPAAPDSLTDAIARARERENAKA